MKASLDHVVSQMDTLTQTVVLLEQRLSLAENKITEIVKH